MRNYRNITIEYSEPDVECDENIPLFDTDECPVCMKKFGITETQQLIGNHPTKKILKTTKKICIKRNTYCGHPLCLDCFKTICENKYETICPICRGNYRNTGDLIKNCESHYLKDKDIYDMIDNKDSMLLYMVDIPKLVTQSVIAGGYKHLFMCKGFAIDDNNKEMFFGKDED